MRPPSLNALVRIFYDSSDDLGKFDLVAPIDMPPPYRLLLDHQHHMTVTVEKHFKSPVDVRVLKVHESDDHYARCITLVTRSDERVVQYGIVRIRWDAVSHEVGRLIRAARVPLGRILIEHNVMRDVSLAGLWRIQPATELKRLFGCPDEAHGETFGRTALIRVESAPAIELLEVVAPEYKP